MIADFPFNVTITSHAFFRFNRWLLRRGGKRKKDKRIERIIIDLIDSARRNCQIVKSKEEEDGTSYYLWSCYDGTDWCVVALVKNCDFVAVIKTVYVLRKGKKKSLERRLVSM